jgi:hypothetical protein
MKESTKILSGILLLIIGALMVILPVVLKNQKNFSVAIGMFLIFFGAIILLNILTKDMGGHRGSHDGWDRTRWRFVFFGWCFIKL